MKSNVFESVIDAINRKLQLTNDILSNTVQITVLGTRGICIENYYKIKTFTSQVIVIDSKSGDVVIKGDKLIIDVFNEDEILIRGRVLEINMESLGENL